MASESHSKLKAKRRHKQTAVYGEVTILCASILGAAMVYPWAYTRGPGIAAGALFMQAGVQGAWAVIPIYLSELAPPTHRSLVVGLSYPLGKLHATQIISGHESWTTTKQNPRFCSKFSISQRVRLHSLLE